MRKHGWRTPEWKLIVSLEPDFHFKPEVELYNLVLDPGENHNLAEEEPGVVAALRRQMEEWIAQERARDRPHQPDDDQPADGMASIGIPSKARKRRTTASSSAVSSRPEACSRKRRKGRRR